MATVAVLAGLAAAVFWGLSPVASKRGLSRGGNPVLVTFVAISTGVVLFAAALLATGGVDALPIDLDLADYGVFVASGLVGTILGRVASYTGIHRVGASVNSAVVATNPLIATALALVFLGERVSAVQAVGVVVVVVGLAALTVSRGGDLGGWSRRDLLFPLAAALAYGVGGVVRRYGLTATPASPLQGVAMNDAAAFVGLACFLLVRREAFVEPVSLRTLAYFVASGVLTASGLFMLFVGLANGTVAVVVTLSGTATLFSMVFSALLLRDLERVTRGVLLGALLVVVGVSLISLY